VKSNFYIFIGLAIAVVIGGSIFYLSFQDEPRTTIQTDNEFELYPPFPHYYSCDFTESQEVQILLLRDRLFNAQTITQNEIIDIQNQVAVIYDDSCTAEIYKACLFTPETEKRLENLKAQTDNIESMMKKIQFLDEIKKIYASSCG